MDKKTYQGFLSWLEEAKEVKAGKNKVKVHDGDEDGKALAEEELAEEQLDEYESKHGSYVHKGTYGSSYQGDDDEDDEPKKKPAPTGEKRGRGRPAGSKSGARTQGAAKKTYSGLAVHSLNLPNSK